MNKRYIEIDFLRGMAVIGMVIFHLAFLLMYLEIYPLYVLEGGWHVLARAVQFTFLSLVGVSMVISFGKKKSRGDFYRKQLRRGVYIFTLGLVVSVATWFASPELYVKFGILHFIGVASVICSVFVGRRWLAFVAALLVFIAAPYIKEMMTESIVLFAVGLRGIELYAFDHFPLFPWLAVPLMGVFLGESFYKKGESPWNFSEHTLMKPVLFCGRHALMIYMFHIPILLILLLPFLLNR